MRTFTIRDERSPHRGEHCVYDSQEEFEQRNSGKEWKKWGGRDPADYKVGEWIRSDDGYIIQILAIRLASNKLPVYFFRVPMGTFAVYWTKRNEKWNYRQILAQFTPACKNSISGRPRTNRSIQVHKIKFATLLVCGVRPMVAARMAFPREMFALTTKHQALTKVAKFMEDSVVRDEIKTQLSKFNEDIIDKFGDKRLLEELDELLTMSKKGSDAHRGNIQFIMELRGLYEKKEGKKINKLRETSYTEVPPSESDG